MTGQELPAAGDNELAASASKGNERAFREIISRFRPRILSICLKMLKNSTEATEAAQDTFVKIYFHLKDYDPEKSFSSWAASIAMNECRDRLRKRKRYSQTFRELSDIDVDTRQTYADEDYESQKRVKRVEDAIEKLPEKLKEVLVLKAYGDYSYEEIAGILKIKIGTVMSRLFRAREKLTEMLEKENLI
ncbi:MAG: RNA polymerase sigma factor [Candidatus Zixiibacteriota bacterium]|nr:MAG: RNA polymerase sigma factor [candidate division Zixibacteria bacterium]